MDDSSKTASNSAGVPGKPFTKGDARINRKGRPKDFNGFRELAQQIAHEEAQARDKETGELRPVIIYGRKVTTAELVLRRWFQSNDGKLQVHAMEIAFGKVPQETRITGAEGKPLLNMQEVIALMAQADKLLAEGALPEAPSEDVKE